MAHPRHEAVLGRGRLLKASVGLKQLHGPAFDDLVDLPLGFPYVLFCRAPLGDFGLEGPVRGGQRIGHVIEGTGDLSCFVVTCGAKAAVHVAGGQRAGSVAQADKRTGHEPPVVPREEGKQCYRRERDHHAQREDARACVRLVGLELPLESDCRARERLRGDPHLIGHADAVCVQR